MAAGLNKLTVSLHGADAATHDAITRRRGSFEQTLAGLAAAARLRTEHRLDLEVNTTLVRTNLAQMRPIWELAARYEVDMVNFNAVEPRGTADELFDQVVPRHDEVIDHADRSNLRFGDPTLSLSRLPPCSGTLAWAQETWHVPHPDSLDVYEPARGRVKGEPCRTCAVAAQCDGLWERYATGYGWEGLVPVVDPATREGQVLRVRTGAPCNNRCVHCFDGPASGLSSPRRPVARQLREGLLHGHRSVEFAGGEPLMDEHLDRHVQLAWEIGYREVLLESNARVLALPGRAEQLSAMGVTSMVVTLNAGTEQVHDRMACVPGAWRQSLRGMQQLRLQRIPFAIRLRLHPDNRNTVAAARALARHLGATYVESIEGAS